jgi:hypothetical protein
MGPGLLLLDRVFLRTAGVGLLTLAVDFLLDLFPEKPVHR